MEILNVWWKRTDGTFFFGDGYDNSTEYSLATEQEVLADEVDRIAQKAIIDWKTNRQNEVDNIVVNHNGVIYQGDEVSQTRMSRALAVMSDTDVFNGWVAKDNSLHNLTKADFIAILKDAGSQQSAIWNVGRP